MDTWQRESASLAAENEIFFSDTFLHEQGRECARRISPLAGSQFIATSAFSPPFSKHV